MITAISTIKTTIKTHITITGLATRGALIALFAGLFILAACGGGGGGGGGDDVAPGGGDPACTNPFAPGCLDAGAVARATQINICRGQIERNAPCANTIPDAVVACLTDPYKDSCDPAAYTAAIRTPSATVTIGALRTGRTNSCRGRTVKGANLCDGAIDNTCQPISVATNASRNQLILDNLCNNAPNYLTARQNFITGCTDRDRFNDVGCTPQIVTCTTEPFGTGCDVDVFASYRAVQCHESSTVNPQCDSIITNYCADNIFIETAGCVSNSAFDGARITECITGNNAEQTRCQNTGIFKTTGLIACFVDPYGTDCDDIEGYNVTNAQNSRKAYCTGIGARADGNMFCAEAITNVCAGEGADIFDPLCFDAIYQTARATACRVTDLNDVRCTETVAQLCANNPFTQTTGGTTVDLCTDADGARAALVTRCAKDNSGAGCANASVGAVTLQQCIDDPYLTGCEDTAFDTIKMARYNNCVGQEATDFAEDFCAGVEATICQSDSGKTNPLANPFFSLCRNSDTGYGTAQRAFCNARVADDLPECEMNFIMTCDADPFDRDCITTAAYELDRALIINACLDEIAADTQADTGSACSDSAGSGITVGLCAANPFDTTNGCSDNAGFAGTRTARTALCAATATPFDSLCNSLPGIDAMRATHCETAETSFSTSCDETNYPGTTALRRSFCTRPANLFTPRCTDAEAQLSLDNARTALALACSENAATAGCDQFANGVFGATIADCTSDLFNTANGCNDNTSFAALRRTRETLCETTGQQFNPLCNDFPNIETLQQTYCTAGAGSFDANCELDHAAGAATARVAFARLCLSAAIAATPRDDCAKTIVAVTATGKVSVADCIDNPYRLECYGTETARNPDFIEEVKARDVACRDGGDIYNSLCLNSAGEEIVEGIIAAREAGCTTPARAAFNDACTETAYPGTETAQRGFCSTDATINDVGDICSPYEVSICADDITANPFAAICGDNGTNQATFCGRPGNTAVGCSDVATVVCPSDPFNPNAGLAGMTDCLMDNAYINNRAALCAAGTEGVSSDCTVSEIADLVCVATGPTANPFASFCERGAGVDADELKMARTSFANACKIVGAIGNCVVETVQTALCSGNGEFIRPFSAVCDGVGTAVAARVSFCGRDDNVTEVDDCDNSVIASACQGDPFSDSCTNTGESYIAELRDLRAAHCESLTDADDLCSAFAVTSVCAGYTGVSGAVPANPLANLCADNSLYDDPRRDACLALNTKNAVCDDIPAVTEACRPNPFNPANSGCALIASANELQMDWCEIGTNTWLGTCDELAKDAEGVNDVARARTNACLAGIIGSPAEACKALESVMMGCEASPFANTGCNVFDAEILAGYELGYCQTAATAWDVECDDLVATGGNTVDDMRGVACNAATQSGDKTLAGYFSPRCNMRGSFRTACSTLPFDMDTPGCAFHENFEEFATSYCTGGTTWEEVCDVRAGLNESNNDVFRARRTACLMDTTAEATQCPGVVTAYCGDTDNSANAFDPGCENADYTGTDTTRAVQLQKACAEGGMNAAGDVANLCMDGENAKTYCTTVDPYAGTGCEELAGDQEVINFRASYCDMNGGEPECGDVNVVCAANPFDGRCVDDVGDTTYATARENRANDCRDKTKTGADCLSRVTACNARPFGATSAHFPVNLPPTTCSTDPAFADARAAFVTKCIEIDAVNDDQDCKNAVADQKAVSGESCLENPYLTNCSSLTQLGTTGNVTKAQNSYCRTTTGMNSFSLSCDGTDTFVMQARVDSCLHATTPVDLNSTCPMLITAYCTATTGVSAFDDDCNEGAGDHRTGNTFVRTTLCANGADDEKCTETGDSFATWRDDSGVPILDAGAGVTSATTNFINGVLNATDKLHLGDNSMDVDIIATTHVVRLNDSSGSVALRGDEEDGFVFARADVDDSSTDKFFAGILHTTDLGRSIENDTVRALWRGVIQAFRYDGTNSYIHNGDFVLRLDFGAGTLAVEGDNGVATLLGGSTLRFSIVAGSSFNKTTGLITGQVLFEDNTQNSQKRSTGTLRGVIGGEGVVAVFRTDAAGSFGDFVGGFVASAVDSIPVCQSLIANPFGDGCLRTDGEVLNAQFKACSTGVLGNNTRVVPGDCNHVQLSGVICSDDIGAGSRANPFAEICSDEAITIFNSAGVGFSLGLTELDGDRMIDLDDVRQKIRNHCAGGLNPTATVCIARQARIDDLSSQCVAADLPTLFGSLCSSYREFVDVQALVCRNRGNKQMSTLDGTMDGFACDTKYIKANVCIGIGKAGNPFDEGICGKDGSDAEPDETYAGARKLFAVRCARDLANDPSVTSTLDGANCMTSGANQTCLETPFITGCATNEDYADVRENRKVICRGHATVKYKDIDGNIFDYDCNGAIIDVCGTSGTPIDDDLFSDKLCTNSGNFDTRRMQIVTACNMVKTTTPEDANCILEVATDISVVSCINDPYQEECAHAAFGGQRAVGLSACNITTFVSMSTTGVDCIKVQTSVCGGGVYAADPFNAFCDKKDAANNDATIAPATLADGRNKYCQIGTNADTVQGCAEFLARPTTAALLDAQTNALEESPNPILAANQFLRGTADGLNTGGFVRKNGDFAFVSTLNLNTATYAQTPLGGDAADGVAYFAGRQHTRQGDIATDVDYYAGILSGTDLGNPLPRQYDDTGGDLEVEWNGRIGWLIYDSEDETGYAFDRSTGFNGVTDFTLTINLTERTIRALIVRSASVIAGFGFLLEGDYGKNGVISGTARYGLASEGNVSDALYSGTLIGLIGEQGAVGAFHLRGSGAEAAQGASGGFVVSSRASAGSDEVNPSPGSFNYWIAEREGVDGAQIDVLGRAEEINENNPNTNFIAAGVATGQLDVGAGGDFGTVRFSEQSPDGLGYGFADYGSGGERFYVGLFASTDLGSPRTETDGFVTWNGRIAIAKQDTQGTTTGSYLSDVVNFQLKITFTGEGGMIETFTGAQNGITFTRSIFDKPNSLDKFVIAGTFDRNGLLRGTTTYQAYDGTDLFQLTGTLTGLIGAEGVAGVFTSDDSGNHLSTIGHYVGGFVASSALDTGGADTWQTNALRPDGTTKLTVKNKGSAVLADDDYTFIASGNDTLELGPGARKSATLTKNLTFDENLTLRNGDVFSLNSGAEGGISIAQATVGGSANVQQLYAGLLGDTFVGAPLDSQPNVNWRGVLSIIAGATPALHTTDFTLSVDFATSAIYSNTVFLRVAGDLDHNIILQGRFNSQGVIYGTATYQTGEQSNAGVLTGLIGASSVAAVFGGDSTSDLGQFIGGLVAVPDGTVETTPNSHFVWVEGIDETEFRGTRFNKGVEGISIKDNTVTWEAENAMDVLETTVTTDANLINLDTTYLGGLGNGDGSNDGFVVFLDTTSTFQNVGIFAGTNLGGPVVNTGGDAEWHARMAGLIIDAGVRTDFSANFTLGVNFDDRAIRTVAGSLPTFVDAGTEYTFTFDGAIKWDAITGLFTGGITLDATPGVDQTKGGVLRGIIGAQGAVGTFRVSEADGRTFIGGFVAVPEAIGAVRGQTSYWAEYARNEDNTAGLHVRGVRGAKLGDGIYTVIEGGLDSLELGIAVDKNTDPDLTYDLKFANTEVSPDGSTFSIDSTVAGGISFTATETRFGKYYAGLLSGTDVGRLLTRTTPSAIWVGRFGVIYGTTSFDNTLSPKDFELVIDFNARTLKSHNPDDTASLTDADAISFLQAGGFSYELIIDGEYNDRGIIYGTTTLQDNDGSALSNVSAGTLTGLIGQKGAAAVFHRTSGNIRYVGGFVAVPDGGEGVTNVRINTPTSFNVWTTDIDTTKQKAGSSTSTAGNTVAFTTKVPDVPSATNQIALNLSLLGGDADDGFIGYADDNARQIGLLSSIDLGGVALETGTATWSVVMEWILGDGGDGILTQNLTLAVDFDARTLTFGDIAFTSNSVAYELTFALVPWNLKSGLITGTINIATTALSTQQVSDGVVHGLIGREGVVVAFRSTDTAHTSFTGGFVAAQIKTSDTPFSEYFSSTAGGEVLEDFVNGGAAKLARVTDNTLRLDGGATAPSAIYRLGASTVNTGSNPNGFIYSTNTSNFAVGILSTTDLGAPLPLEKTGVAEWTGELYRSNASGLQTITLNVDFIKGTIKTKTPSTDIIRIDGYFGLNPLAVAAKLPLGYLGGMAVYHRSTDPMETELTLIGQIGRTGVVGIFRGEIKNNGPTQAGVHVLGGFTAFSSEVTANAREFNTKQAINVTRGIIDIGQDGQEFLYANSDGNIKDATSSYRVGLGGVDNTPSVTNPNGFTLAGSTQGFSVAAGIWAHADLGLLLPQTPNAFAIWTGTVQTLRAGTYPNRTIAGNSVSSAFKIQVNFEGRKISTLNSSDAKGAVMLDDGHAIEFTDAGFDGNGVIGCPSTCRVDYTINSTSYRLVLTGLIGQKGALGLFRGVLSTSQDPFERSNAPVIVGGFQVTPSARVTIDDPNPPRVVVIPPKQLNYDAYLEYYQTNYVTERHGPSVLAMQNDKVSQFLQSADDGTGLSTLPFSVVNSDSFKSYGVYLNGDDSTGNGFALFATSGSSVIVDSVYRNYAGLLAGADVGRFSDALLGTATWQGRFYSSAITVGADSDSRIPTRLPLTLTVDFDAGTIGTLGDVRLLNDHLVNIAGTFGFDNDDENQGILGGFITYTDPSAIVAQRITRAPIYGIIGDAGALGVFASGKYGATGNGADSPLVGGFEVSPNPVATVNYKVFDDFFSGLGTNDGRRVYDTITQFDPPRSYFIKGTRTGLVLTGLETAKPLSGGTIRLAGNERSPSGFALLQHFTTGRPRGHTYAALLTGTDLGAVLPIRFASGSTTAVWEGRFYTTAESIVGKKITVTKAGIPGRGNLTHAPLSLTVDLAAGTLRTVNLLGNLGTVALSATDSVQIDAQFGFNARTAKLTYGILLGTVTYNQADYELAGLIGVDGAIGIFRQNSQFSTVGGFEVSPPPPPAYGRTNYAVFENFYHRVKVSEDIRYLTGRESITANKAQFVRGTQIGLVNHALTGTLAMGSFAPLTVYLGGDVHSGNAFVIENFNGTHVAGLLASTDLGAAPHESLTTATWDGTFYVSSDVTGMDTSAPEGFIIEGGVVVNFGAGTLTASQAEYELANGQFASFGIFGEFGRINELPLGILAGVVKYSSAASSVLLAATDLRDLPLIGVIGRDGALGVFRDSSDDNNLVGGFQAGYSASYRVWDADISGGRALPSGFNPNLSSTTSSNINIQKVVFLEANDLGTGLISDVSIASFAGTAYRLDDVTTNPNGFILAGGTITTVPFKDDDDTTTSGDSTLTPATPRVAAAGLLKTTNLGPAISEVVGSASWTGGKAYVIDTHSTTTKVFNLTFNLNFATGVFSTGAAPVAEAGGGGQTLKIEGIFGRGLAERARGVLDSRGSSTNKLVTYFDSSISAAAITTTKVSGLIGRDGLVGIFSGWGHSIFHGFVGGFWASPSTDAPTANYDNFEEFYNAETESQINTALLGKGPVAFLDGTTSSISSQPVGTYNFRLGGADDTDTTNKNGLHFRVYSLIKTVGILDEADLGVINPNTKARATWLGRLFVKTDETEFNINTDQKQIGLRLDFAAGTITTAQPVEFRLGAETHSVSILGSFGLHEFARGSGVRPTSGLLSGFVTYTHHARPSVNVPLIGLIGVEGALGIFKSRVAGIGVGVVGGFEVSPIPSDETNLPNHDTYARQFKGYVNGTFKDNFANQISTADGVQLIRTPTTRNPNGTNDSNIIEESFRLGGTTDSGNANYGDGFVFAKYIGTGDKSVGLLFTTDLGAVVSGTATATWSGRLVVHYARQLADTKNSQLDLQVDFGAGTIETLAPISIVTYIAGNPSTRKQTVEVRGRFGSHLDALGLRTGILGGSIVYKVGHLTPSEAAALTPSNEVTRNSVTTAHLPLLGLIGEQGAIGVFHGSVKNIGIVGGFEVSPRAALPATITASFGRWARFATECGDIDTSENTTIMLDTECAIVEHTALAFAHPNDLFESDNDLTAGVRPVSKGFVLGSNKATGIDFSDALSPIPGDAAVRVLTLGGDNFADGTFAAGDVLFDSTGKRFTFGGDAIGTSDDGITFVTHYSPGTTFYAGLLSTTDLGAPLGATFDGEVTASWPGRFVVEWYDAVYPTNDFVLDINFTAKTFSTAGVSAATLDWILQGRYDASGIITGIIKNTAENLTRIGTLTGLIGVQGAVATFIIDEEAAIGQNISYVGGFVAAPVGTISGTSYAHFDLYHKAQTEQRQLHTDLNLASGDEAGLLAATATGFDTAGATGFGFGTTGGFQGLYYLDGGTSRAEGQARSGADEDGFAILRGRHSSAIIYRAGILAGTDLGSSVNADLAPASADATALWTGIGYVIHSSNTASKTEPFATEALNFSVDFVNGTIRTVANSIGDSGEFGAVVGATNRFGVRGTFGGDLPPGILGGTVTYGLAEDDTEDSIMELSGLIGRDGAIGVFANEASASLRYAGGFSARPFALTPAAANDNPPTNGIVASVLPDHPTRGLANEGGFVTLGNTLTSTNVTNHLPTAFTLDVGPYTLRNDIDFTGGVGFFAATNDPNTISYHYAGVLADTNLGAHRDETEGTATWKGQFSDHDTVNSGDKNDFIDFHIDFGRGELQFLNTASNRAGGTLTRDSNVYTLDGIFGNRIIDKNGNILTTGQLGGQITRTAGGVTRVAAISGLIGEEGVVGAFVNTTHLSLFAGGFWAVPELAEPVDLNDKLVNFADWSDVFGRATPPPTEPSSTRKSEFLTGNAAIVSGKGLNEPTDVVLTNFFNAGTARLALTFDNATYDGEPLDGAGTAADGVAGFAVTFDNGRGDDHKARYRYVGLLSGTDLGAPISADTPVGAWKGQFVGIRKTGGSLFRTSKDFTLNVTYTGTGGTFVMSNAANTGNITDSNRSQYYYAMVGGKFDASGVISGTINFHSEGNTAAGILTGLIGVDGAVGAFISGTAPTVDGKKDIGNISEHVHTAARFYGGFVASAVYEPPADLKPTFVDYADWAGATSRKPLPSGAATPPLESQFLLSTGDALNTEQLTGSSTSVNLSTATNGGTALGGDTTDGFAYRAVSGVNDIFLVGITETTDLGAPLDATTALGTWNGSFVVGEYSGISATFTPHDFTLAVTFGGVTGKAGSVASGTIGGTGYAFTGDFDSRGVIIGTTTHAENGGGVLQGLIGVQGAVGVFYSNPTGAPSGAKPYGGGFVAKIPPPDPCIALRNCTAKYAFWGSSFDTGGVNASQPLRDSGFTNAVITTDTVRGTSDYIKLDGDNKIVTSGGTFNTTILRLNETASQDGYESGFAYAYDNINTTGQTYAGILSTTDVGLPLADNTKNGTWTGRLAGITGVGDSLGSDTDDFSLKITFGGTGLPTGSVGTIMTEGTLGFATIDGSSGGIRLIGDFNAAGVMWGTINLGGAVDDNGTFSGLIGAKGAVGVFEGVNPTYSFAGGFFAKLVPPPPPDPCIARGDCATNYAAWTRSFDTGEVNASQPLQESSFTNAVRDTSDYIKLTDDNKINLVNGDGTASTFTPVILRLNEMTGEDGYESGFAYFNANGGGFIGQIYAGILPTTNLGAPLVDGTKDGKWTGRLQGITGYGEPPLGLDTFSLQVTWVGSSPGTESVGTIKSLDGDDNVGYAPVGGIRGGINFTGDFNAVGVMWGSVDFGAETDNGTFSGLIGAKGAVGVFEGANSAYGFAGGFEVKHVPSN